MAKHNEIGKWGEELACQELIKQGCAIMDRNWHMGHYEVDIIAMKDDFIIFAEVKTRSDDEIDPLEAIDRKKMSFMVRSAMAYMNKIGIHRQARFDVFGISGSPDNYKIEYIPDAFMPPMKTYR